MEAIQNQLIRITFLLAYYFMTGVPANSCAQTTVLQHLMDVQ